MTHARLISLERALPATTYPQSTLLDHSPWPRTPLIERLFLDSPVQTRAFFVPPSFWAEPRTLTDTNAAWRAGALALGEAALSAALSRAGVATDALAMLGVTTVTGYATPGLDLLLAAKLGLSNQLARAHFNNIGCHAAVPLLRVAAQHAVTHPGQACAALAVEVCSACFQPSDDPENLVALSLFGDGAAAAVLCTEGEGPEIVDFASIYDFEHLDALGFALDDRGFRIVLRPSVPDALARALPAAVDALLARHGLRRDDVYTWALHPGGSRILDACEAALGLPADALRASRRVLRAFGNMSSPSVLFVLDEAQRTRPAPAGAPILLASFGPGLGAELALLRG